MTNEEKKKLYEQLSAPFPEGAIERTEGRLTGRGYDTSGIKYQYVVNRLNEVLGLGGWRTQHEIRVREITTAKGRGAFDVCCDVTVQLGRWDVGTFVPFAEAHSTGGHQSMNEADARKGAFTNGLKKCVAMFGCGKQAYEGTLDDDNVPVAEAPFASERRSTVSQVPHVPSVHSRPSSPPVTDVPHVPSVPSIPSQVAYAVGVAPARSRLTAKQLSAIWALARKLGLAQGQFRLDVKARYGVQPEFLDRNAASDLITGLSAKASNGSSHPAQEGA